MGREKSGVIEAGRRQMRASWAVLGALVVWGIALAGVIEAAPIAFDEFAGTSLAEGAAVAASKNGASSLQKAGEVADASKKEAEKAQQEEEAVTKEVLQRHEHADEKAKKPRQKPSDTEKKEGKIKYKQEKAVEMAAQKKMAKMLSSGGGSVVDAKHALEKARTAAAEAKADVKLKTKEATRLESAITRVSRLAAQAGTLAAGEVKKADKAKGKLEALRKRNVKGAQLEAADAEATASAAKGQAAESKKEEADMKVEAAQDRFKSAQSDVKAAEEVLAKATKNNEEALKKVARAENKEED